MATNEGFDGDPLSSSGGFSHLLESNEVMGLDLGNESFIYSSSFPCLKPPTMLCFGNVCNKNERVGFRETAKSRIIINGSDSSSASSSNNSSCSNTINKSKRNQTEEVKTEHEMINGSGQDSGIGVQVSGLGNGNENRRTNNNKKPKKEKSISTGPVKVRKEKLGERITALQQLVSPFGKTDTASVLHEAMGYIRFLHDQVQVLSSPYLQSLPSSSSQEVGRGGGGGGGDGGDEEVMKKKKKCFDGGGVHGGDLRSRGLCLVPVEYTVHVADCNGADMWSPAAAMQRP